MKKYWIYIVLIVLLLAILVSTDTGKPRQIDWTPYYTSAHKEPLGTYAFYHLAAQAFPDRKIDVDRESLYSFLDERIDSGKNVIIINNEVSFDKEELKMLLDYAGMGNNVFIAAETIGGMDDTLGIKQNSYYNPDSTEAFIADEPQHIYYFPGNYTSTFVDSPNESVKVLGYRRIVKNSVASHANFIKVNWGYGAVYICMIPYAFTNDGLLHTTNMRYAFSAISYLPVNDTYLLETYDTGGEQQTPLIYILSQPALRWAYYLLLCSLLIYIFFEGKRRQRIIPVIQPLSNATVEFVETVGRLYFHNGDHKNLAEKKISHFYEFLRKKLFMRIDKTDDEFIVKLHSKTGFDQTFLRQLFNSITFIQNSSSISATQLMELNGQIDKFYKKYNP
jgi:hypothetical protein